MRHSGWLAVVIVVAASWVGGSCVAAQTVPDVENNGTPAAGKMASPIALGLLDLAKILVAQGEVENAEKAVRQAVTIAPSLREQVQNDSVLAPLLKALEPSKPAPLPVPRKGEISDVWLTGAQIWSSPVFADGAIYFGSDDGTLYSLDIDPLMPRWRVTTGGRIRTTPAVADGRVYFASDDGFLYCVDVMDGRQHWRFDLASAGIPRVLPSPYPPHDYDFLSSAPVVVGDLVLIGSADGHLYAVDAATGKKKWQFRTSARVRSTPVVAHDTVFVGSWDGFIYALDLTKGKEIWRFDTGGIVQSTPALGDGLLFVGSRSASIFALDQKDGKAVWQFAMEEGSWVESSGVYSDGVLYVGSSDALELLAIDGATGEVQWSYRTGGWSWGAPSVTEDTVYIGAISAYPYYREGVDLQQGIHAVDRSSGERRWLIETHELPGYLTGGVISRPLVIGKSVVVGALDSRLLVVRDE